MRSNNEAELARVRTFATHQANVAEAMRIRLITRWRDRGARQELLRTVHHDLIEWRHGLARSAPGRLGTGIPLNAERFRTAIDTQGANYDRIGYVGRLRTDPVWDNESRTFRGGSTTPAHDILLAYGRAAEERFFLGEEVLYNNVTLPDGKPIRGNSLVRGQEAERIANQLLERINRRLGNANQVETGGAPMYVVTANNAARATMFATALNLLAAAEPGDVVAWQTARYLLYQAPVTKKGSDAVTRTFLVAVGSVLLARAPILEQDVDLRCIVLGQDEATSMSGDLV